MEEAMDKKAQTGDMLSIGYFILLLIIIGGTIFLMSKLVLGVAYDARLTDASILGYTIQKCISENNLKESDFGNIQQICGIRLSDGNNEERKFVLHIYADNKELFKYGDRVSCGLYELNNKNTRCVDFITKGNLNGKQTEFQIISGSNLESYGGSNG